MSYIIIGDKSTLHLNNGLYEVNGLITIGDSGIERIDDSTWRLINGDKE